MQYLNKCNTLQKFPSNAIGEEFEKQKVKSVFKKSSEFDYKCCTII